MTPQQTAFILRALALEARTLRYCLWKLFQPEIVRNGVDRRLVDDALAHLEALARRGDALAVLVEVGQANPRSPTPARCVPS